ncbi:hypothetical protein P7K49_018786 [Saguinus oedipus]|nr:hypothetical protein P7K49_018786 [Saguinus oedipus]
MPKCPKCDKEVYFAERVTSLGKDWHRPCLKCEKCGKTLTSGGHAEHEGKPYCNHPCYAAMFGPKGFGRGGAESHTFKEAVDATLTSVPVSLSTGGGDRILGRWLGHSLSRKCQASSPDAQGSLVSPNALNKPEHVENLFQAELLQGPDEAALPLTQTPLPHVRPRLPSTLCPGTYPVARCPAGNLSAGRAQGLRVLLETPLSTQPAAADWAPFRDSLPHTGHLDSGPSRRPPLRTPTDVKEPRPHPALGLCRVCPAPLDR